MSNAFSRRDFLKASAAAVLALSVSGTLTGCGDSGELAENEAILGDFKVQVVSAATELKSTTSNGNATEEYWVKPTIKVIYTGKGFNSLPYSNVFSAEVDGQKMKLTDPSGNLTNADFPFMDNKTVTLSFKAEKLGVQELFEKDGKPMKLTINFFGNSIDFYLRYADRRITIKKS